jgi:hypothetical protein
MDAAAKAQEARARRKAQRMGYELRRNRSRDPDTAHYGLYMLWRTSARGLARPVVKRWMTLDEVEEVLTS